MTQPSPAPTPGQPPTTARRLAPALAVAAGVLAVAAAGAVAVSTLDDRGPQPVAAVSSAPATTAPTVEPTAPEASTSPSAAPTGSAPTVTIVATPPDTEPAVPAVPVQVWFVTEYRPGSPALVPETVDVNAGANHTPDAVVTAAVQYLLANVPQDPDYSNGYLSAPDPGRPAPTATVTSSDTGTTVDVSSDAFSEGLGSEFAYLALQQLVRTVVANGGTGPVQVLVDGAPGAEVWGALTLDQAVPLDEAVVSLGWITSPGEGERVSAGRVVITGEATGFEGEVDWEVLDASGAVVDSGFTSAGANGLLGEVSIEVDLAPGDYTARLFDASEASAGEGPPVIFQDNTRFTVG